MKVIILAVFLGVVAARPQAPAAEPAAAPAASPKANVTIVKNERNPNDGKGNYNYDIELSDGTKLVQMGATLPPPAGGNDSILVVKGSYSYVDPNGKTILVMYVADDKGFVATGDSIPTSPPNPNAASGAAPAPAASAAPPAAIAHVAETAPETAPLETQASSIASAPSAIV